MTATLAARWVARGFTDDVTTCEHCGRVDLKGTVRMEAVSPEANESDGENYMGVVCAAKMTGRKAADVRTEANRADRAREQAVRDTHRAWSDAHTRWFVAQRETALGPNARYAEIQAWRANPEHRAAETSWLATNPEPARPW